MSLAGALKEKVIGVVESKKIADLERDRLRQGSGTYYTTDHGVKVSDTDNWWVASTLDIMWRSADGWDALQAEGV